jgi:hypothetical protein
MGVSFRITDARGMLRKQDAAILYTIKYIHCVQNLCTAEFIRSILRHWPDFFLKTAGTV